MILNPLEEFVITRQLNDPADSNIYYVQAVIRNAKTDAVIATVNLDNKGSQRFTKTWQVVSDPTGLGLYITITTTVYTDSGYTTKSTTYGVEQHEHLVQDRINPWLRAAGADVDYKRVRKIIQEELENLPKVEIPGPKKFELLPVIEGLHAVIDEVRAIQFPEHKETDTRPILMKLEVMQRLVNVLAARECDHREVIEAVGQATSSIRAELGKSYEQAESLMDRAKGFFDQDAATTHRLLKDVDKKLAAYRNENSEKIIQEHETKKIKENKKRGSEILKQYLNGS